MHQVSGDALTTTGNEGK